VTWADEVSGKGNLLPAHWENEGFSWLDPPVELCLVTEFPPAIRIPGLLFYIDS
jgi:hypothetical protein